MTSEERIEQLMQNLSQERAHVLQSFVGFKNSATRESSLDKKTQSLIFIALAVASQCEMCITFYVKEAKVNGASKEEIIDASMLSTVMGGGPKLMYMSYVYEELDKIFV